MYPIHPTDARDLLDALIAGFAVLGGCMAFFSGFAACLALGRDDPPPQVAHCINEGLGEGFIVGAPAAAIALMIVAWT